VGEPAREWDLPKYAKQRIRIKAMSLVGHYWLTWADMPDIEQRLATEIWDGLRKYDPTRGDPNGFIYVLVEKAAATVIEAEKAKKRQADRAVWSIDSAINGPDGRSTTVAEVTEATEAGRRRGIAAEHFTGASDRKMAVQAFVAGLSGDLRDLCGWLLAGLDPTDIEHVTGTSRGTIYDRRKKLRRLMEESGLEEYLPASGASTASPVDDQ